MTQNEMKEYIDNANYETLLRKWRFAPSGDPFLQGEMGDYYSKVMFEKRDKLEHHEQVRISKELGFGK